MVQKVHSTAHVLKELTGAVGAVSSESSNLNIE